MDRDFKTEGQIVYEVTSPDWKRNRPEKIKAGRVHYRKSILLLQTAFRGIHDSVQNSLREQQTVPTITVFFVSLIRIRSP